MTTRTGKRSTVTPRQHPAGERRPATTDSTTPPRTGTSAAPGRFGGRLRLTAHPDTFGQRFLNSAAVWLALMAFWALADLLLTLFPPGGRPLPPEGGLALAVYTLLGLAAIWTMHRTGFPATWDSRLPVTHRLLLPLLVGAGIGLVASGIDLVTGTTRILEAKLGTAFNPAFPGSVLVSASGAIKFEFLFLLLPVPVLLWFISNVALKGRGQAPTFWVLAVLSSALEPALQGASVLAIAQGAIPTWVFTLYVVESFAHNFASAVLFRRYGLLAAILVRLGHYMIWHVAYGNFFA